MFERFRKRFGGRNESKEEIQSTKDSINVSKFLYINENVSSCTTIREIANLLNSLEFPLFVAFDDKRYKYIDKREFSNSFKTLVDYPKKNKFVTRPELVYTIFKLLGINSNNLNLTIERILLNDDPDKPYNGSNKVKMSSSVLGLDLYNNFRERGELFSFKSAIPFFKRYEDKLPRDQFMFFGKIFHDFRLISSILDKNAKLITKDNSRYNFVPSKDLDLAKQIAREIDNSEPKTNEFFGTGYPKVSNFLRYYKDENDIIFTFPGQKKVKY